jgi:hypothetical protein
VKCNHCGQINKKQSKFCSNCGSKLILSNNSRLAIKLLIGFVAFIFLIAILLFLTALLLVNNDISINNSLEEVNGTNLLITESNPKLTDNVIEETKEIEEIVVEENNTDNTSKNDCIPHFLEETKCVNGAILKEYQKINCDITWAYFGPCERGLTDIPEKEPFNRTYNPNRYLLSNALFHYDSNLINFKTDNYNRIRTTEDNILHSFIFTKLIPVEINIPIANGCYHIITFHGDLYPAGPDYIEIERIVFNEKKYFLAGEIINFRRRVCITDKNLNISFGSETAHENIDVNLGNGLGYTSLNAMGIARDDQPGEYYYINFGSEEPMDDKGLNFLKDGLMNS